MRDFLKRNFLRYFIIVIVLTLLITWITTGVSDGQAGPLGNVLGIIVSPVQKSVTYMTGGIGSFFDGISKMRSAVKENELLNERIRQLEGDSRDYEEFKNENERLRSLLEFVQKQKQKNLDAIAAEVVAKEPGNWYSVFTLDKGTANGVNVNSVVITQQGLVGRVFEAGTTWAKVTAIINFGNNASAVLTRTGDRVVIEGDVELQENGLSKMSLIPNDADIMVGDPVETSGAGGIYPAGIFVGRVKNINHEQGDVYREVTVEPAVDFSRIREVLIIRQ